MQIAYSTPLLDYFRKGEVDREVRLLAAAGALAPRAGEQLALLVLLLDDEDEAVARTAAGTLDRIPRPALEGYLARTDAPAELREFFARRGLQPAARPAPEADQPLYETAPEAETTSDAEAQNRVPVAMLPVMQRLKLAFRGTREQRAILIRDSNRMVAVAVLSSPKVSESEVESFARMASVSEDVLRIIGTSRSWIKNYGVLSALVRNPRTPPAISMRLVPHLNLRDVRMLAVDRNVPEVLRASARKIVITNEARRR